MREATTNEYLLSLEPPTLHANRAYIIVNGQFTRIALGEEIAQGQLYYRHAVLMDTNDAVDLALTILRLVDEDEKKRRTATEGPGEPNVTPPR